MSSPPQSARRPSRVLSGATIGFDGHLIDIESDAAVGLPALTIVGLGNKAVIESRERIRSAVANSGFTFPARRLTVNMAPAGLPKTGTHFDLPIALSLLVVSGQLRPADVAGTLFAGELALDGSLRPVPSALSLAELARANGLRRIVLPSVSARQAAVIDGVSVHGFDDLTSVFRFLKGISDTKPAEYVPAGHPPSPVLRLDDISGQQAAKRAAIIAAAGHHNILLSGPPGSGKTLLAKTMAGLLPDLSIDEKIATTKIHNLADLSNDELMTTRSFRAPHHTASVTSLIGGASLRPGEISLAHLGVLFLDEMPEYPRSVLEALRQPLEDKRITVTRASGSYTFPADFMLVGTRNPCPCGYFGDPHNECTCSAKMAADYAARLSGPLLDRIDIIVDLPRVAHNDLLNVKRSSHAEHDDARARIDRARQRQSERAHDVQGVSPLNAGLSSAHISGMLAGNDAVRMMMNAAAERLDLSARAYFKVLKVARTIADLDDRDELTVTDVGEALRYRVQG